MNTPLFTVSHSHELTERAISEHGAYIGIGGTVIFPSGTALDAFMRNDGVAAPRGVNERFEAVDAAKAIKGFGEPN